MASVTGQKRTHLSLELLLFCVCVSPNKVQFYVSTAIFCILAVNAKIIIIKKKNNNKKREEGGSNSQV